VCLNFKCDCDVRRSRYIDGYLVRMMPVILELGETMTWLIRRMGGLDPVMSSQIMMMGLFSCVRQASSKTRQPQNCRLEMLPTLH